MKKNLTNFAIFLVSVLYVLPAILYGAGLVSDSFALYWTLFAWIPAIVFFYVVDEV